MNTFLWLLFWLLVLENIGRIVWLTSGRIPARTPGQVAIDLVLSIALLCWVISLLAKGA